MKRLRSSFDMSQRPVRLPPLPTLRVKKPVVQTQANPCLVIMSSLLNCWSSNGESNKVCKKLETDLKVCMESSSSTAQRVQKSSINYHTTRLQPKVNGKPHD
ncbi:hypothetical protein PACTADRAFT_1810 [Pachysolen tannophilus NRRL Y-2460]|uniref:Small ribosomal subunit protein mS37 n=1 Tax=Pachysolen tannophilus NRRL Y-2460 TaxID=669874 RepID=A0A1E4TZS6_PACTA|nr:hypothetical protein PACTADRAFT_1810 [Pachysolen tannophilus NRRL Y-2460]